MTEISSRMTDRERVEALIKGDRPDRVPIYPFAIGISMTYTQTPIADAFNNPEVSLSGQRKTCRDFGWLSFPMIAYAAFGSWEFGGEVKWPSGEYAMAPSVLRRPVEKEKDVWKLEVPNVEMAGIVPLQLEFFQLLSQEQLDNEPFNTLCYSGGPFTKAANMAGIEELCKWMIKKPEAVHRLMRLITDFLKNLIEYWCDNLGTEGVLPWGADPSSSNQMISPRHFEEYALPYTMELNEKTLSLGYKHIFCHICGEHNLNLKYWAKIPFGDPGFLSFGHEVDLEKAAEYFPHDIIIGNLDPSILQTGTPEEVYKASRRVVEIGKKLPTGFILGPGCEMPPKAPIENLKHMTKAVEDFGWYD